MQNVAGALLGLVIACRPAAATPAAKPAPSSLTQTIQRVPAAGATTPSASSAPPAGPPALLKRPRSRWQTRGKNLSVAAAADLVTSLQRAGWTVPDGSAFVETRGSYERLLFRMAQDGREGSLEVLRPALSLETQFVPPKLRGARLNAARSAHTFDELGDTFVSVEMTGGGSVVRAAKLRDELIELARQFLVGEVRPTNRDFAENKEGIYLGSTDRVPAVAFSLSGLSAILRESGWHLATTTLPVFQVGAYEMVRFSTGRGGERADFTLVRPASSSHLRIPFTRPAERGRELDPSSSAFVHDDVGEIFVAVQLTSGGDAEDANALLERLLTRARAPN